MNSYIQNYPVQSDHLMIYTHINMTSLNSNGQSIEQKQKILLKADLTEEDILKVTAISS